MKDILFEITPEHLDTGLFDFPVGYCPTSFVDEYQRLYYVGHPIQDICYWSVEKVLYLLYHKKEGSSTEVQAFAEDLQKRAPLDGDTLHQIRSLPNHANATQIITVAIHLMAMNICTYRIDVQEDSLNIIAKMGSLVATVINHHDNCTLVTGSGASLVERFVQMLQVKVSSEEMADARLFKQVLNLILNLYMDYGGGDLPTFVAKALSSGKTNSYSAIAAAMSAFAGSYHSDMLSALLFVKNIAKNEYTDADVKKLIVNMSANDKEIPAFTSHYSMEDPRATILYEFAKSHLAHNKLVQAAFMLRTNSKPCVATVDAISGVLLSVTGFDYPQYFLPIIGWARSLGIAIQLVYERLDASSGKGSPLFRPRYIYKS